MMNQLRPRRVAVIMAGGSGERFWPLSRRNRPKQLLRLTPSGETMLWDAVQRITPLIPLEHVYVATGEHLVDAVREAGLGVPAENILGEPCKRNTAGCLAFATAHLLAKYGEEGAEMTMAVLTADHQVGDAEAFRATVETVMAAAESENALATVGIVPTRPETGYGYIHINADRRPLPGYGEGEEAEQGSTRGAVPVYAVAGFDEKPALPRAAEFVRSGRSFWNSGLFFWQISVFLAELELASPGIAKAIRAMVTALQADDEAQVRRVFEGLDNIAIDRALMERAGNVVMARATFPWDDVGTWAALDRTWERDASGNVVVGAPVVVDCSNSVVYNDAGPDVTVGVVGMKDVVVVATHDAVLVVPKDRAQDVRDVVAVLKQRNDGRV